MHVEQLPLAVNQRQKRDGDIVIGVQVSTSTSAAIAIILHGNQSREVAPCIAQSNRTFPTKTLFPQQRQINTWEEERKSQWGFQDVAANYIIVNEKLLKQLLNKLTLKPSIS